jgi:hypothetical protein
MPFTTTWAAIEHLPQACGNADEPNSWSRVLELMLQLCTRLGNHAVGFNELSGNSLPHLHLVSHQPVTGLGLYAVQQSAARLSRADRQSVARLGIRQGYPIEVIRIGLSDPAAAAAAGAALIAEWRSIGGTAASANCAALIEDGHAVLYLFPRCRLLRAQGWRATPAFMELSGVFIASDPEEMAKIRNGQFDHAHFTRVLSSLRPPLFGSCDAFKFPMRGARSSTAPHVCNQ